MDFVYHRLIHLHGDPQERPWQVQLKVREGIRRLSRPPLSLRLLQVNTWEGRPSDRDLVFLQNLQEKPNSVGTQERRTACHLPCLLYSCVGVHAHRWAWARAESAALCHCPTACARARKSETEKGLALAVAKAWHLHLGELAHRAPVVLLGSRNILLTFRKDTMPGGGGRDSTSPSC